MVPPINHWTLSGQRVYHTISSSGLGSPGTNYDETSYGYDSMRRRNRTGTPGGTIRFDVFDVRNNDGITQIEYDDLNRTLRTTDQLGDTVTHDYDAAGRLTSRDYRTRANSPSDTISDSDTFTYDDVSRMLTAVSGRYSNTVTHTYDAAGRKDSESLTISGQTYTCDTEYDAAGRVSKFTYPDGTEVERGHTGRGQLHTVKVDTTTVDTRGYDDGGRMTSSSYNNGVSESRSYNDDNTLSSISYSGAAIGDLSYGWDLNRNKTSETIGGVMSGYGFTATQNRTHSAANEILTVDSDNVDHDPKGNTTLIPPVLRPGSDPLKIKWDFDNKLRSADIDDSGTDDVFYRWDALGRRVGRDDGTDDVVYFQVGQQTFADYPAGTAASSPTYNYVYGSYIDEIILRTGSGGNRYYHRNQQYSITALTNASGTITERYSYTAYGQPTFFDASGTTLACSAENNRYTYTGREWDEELHLYHYRARMYDAVAGRFCSRDPIGFSDGFNLFAAYFVPGTLDPQGTVCMVYYKCQLISGKKTSWYKSQCDYDCGLDTSKDGKSGSGDPPGTRNLPGVGGKSCHDPDIQSKFYRKWQTRPFDIGACSCDESYTATEVYDSFAPPTDCSETESRKKWDKVLEDQKKKCHAIPPGPVKKLCSAIFTSMQQTAKVACSRCERK